MQPKAGDAGGSFRIILRHRDRAGKLYTVAVEARRVVTHNLESQKGRTGERTVFRFPKMELAAFMDGDVLRLCRRDDVLQFLRGERTTHRDGPPDGDQLL